MTQKPFKHAILLLTLLCVTAANAEDLKVKQGDFVQTTILTGSLTAQKAERFAVPRTNSWRIQLKWMVKEGTAVKPGDPVVRFDTSNLVSDIENMEMSLQGKKELRAQKLAELEHKKFELDVQLKRAETNYKKIELDAAVPRGLESNQKYDQLQLDLKKNRQTLENTRLEKKVRLAALTADIRKLEIETQEERDKLRKNKEMLKGLVLHAVTEGTVVYSRHQWQGRKIQVGDNVVATWTVATIPDINSLQVEAWVNETGINELKKGQKVNMILDAYPEKQFTGSVIDVQNSAEKRKQWGKAHYFMVRIGLDEKDLTIMKPGMSVKCLVTTAEHADALLIPITAVHYDGRDFLLKPKGKDPVTVKPLGMNEFHMALNHHDIIKTGAKLEIIDPASVKSKGENQ